jgi:3',5'-cyclic AMP phosphodiesterase CpdA
VSWDDIKSSWSTLPVILLVVLDGYLKSYEQVYLPWYRFPSTEDLPSVCFWSGLAAMTLTYLSLMLANDRFEKKPALIRPALHACSAFSCFLLLVALIIPPAYILHRSETEFVQFPRSSEVRASEANGFRGGRPLFVLLSDIHVTNEKHTLEGFPPDKDRFREVLGHAMALAPQYLVMSGDLTDRGKAEEWHLFDSVVSGTPSRPRSTDLLLVPGNHDIQGAPQEGVGNREAQDYYEFSRLFAQREHLFYEEVERSGALLSSEYSVGAPEKDYSRAWSATQKLIAQIFTRSHFVRVGPDDEEEERWVEYPVKFEESLNTTIRQFDLLFPIIDRSHLPNSVAIILNSNSQVMPGGSMGLGTIGQDQLNRLAVELNTLKQTEGLKYLIVALHHAPIRHETDVWQWRTFVRERSNSDVFEHTFLALSVNDAQKLIETLNDFALARKDVNVILLHGHRHQKYLGKTEAGLWIVEAPALVENENGFWTGYDQAGQFHIEWIDTAISN